eukprot:5932667-Alexandrium_andersonii.AAC.1
MRFVPIVERVIEGSHSLLKKRAGHNRASPASLSATLRHPLVMEPIVTRGPTDLEHLVECIASVRHIRQCVGALGLQHHPLIARLLADGSASTADWNTAVASVVYRCDIAG